MLCSSAPRLLLGRERKMQMEPGFAAHAFPGYGLGARIFQSFLQEDLIEEMIITRIPILLGDGIPLFGYLPHPMKFSIYKTEVLTEEMVKSENPA